MSRILAHYSQLSHLLIIELYIHTLCHATLQCIPPSRVDGVYFFILSALGLSMRPTLIKGSIWPSQSGSVSVLSRDFTILQKNWNEHFGQPNTFASVLYSCQPLKDDCLQVAVPLWLGSWKDKQTSEARLVNPNRTKPAYRTMNKRQRFVVVPGIWRVVIIAKPDQSSGYG